VFVNSLLATFVMELLWILCALTLPLAGERRTPIRHNPPAMASFAELPVPLLRS
jgi:hypothetical protein